MRIVAILQARMDSTRLPGKMLMPLAGAPVVQRVIERVQRAKRPDEIVLAVPAHDAATFAPIARTRCELYAYPLDDNDLVGRYLAAAQAFEADIIVRIPCDNPCLDPVFLDQAVDWFLRLPTCFYSNTTAWAGGQWVDGIGVEVYARYTLQYLDAYATVREHPHQYFYANHLASLPEADLRLDVNTQQEYAFIKDIYDALAPANPHFTTADILTYLDRNKVVA